MANDSAGITYDLGSIPGLHSFHLFFPIKRSCAGSVTWSTIHLPNPMTTRPMKLRSKVKN